MLCVWFHPFDAESQSEASEHVLRVMFEVSRRDVLWKIGSAPDLVFSIVFMICSSTTIVHLVAFVNVEACADIAHSCLLVM